MNKLACLLLLPFAFTRPLAAAPPPVRPLCPVVLPAAPVADWAWLDHRGRGRATTRPSAIRALARLLRAYVEPGQPAGFDRLTTGAPFPPFSLPHA